MAAAHAPEAAEVTLFREYLRIKTVQPQPDYAGCTKFLERVAADLGLPVRMWEGVPGKPIVVMTWAGADPSLPSILLNSHTDVVPVFPELWKHDPFGAHKDEEGNIYARGTQDMKSVGMQYVEAVRRLRARGAQLLRTIHLMFVPDEEIGGKEGMKLFVESELFKSLNVAFALDEGLASPTDVLPVYYGERVPWWVRVIAKGRAGHGSQFIADTATSKLLPMVQRLLALRAAEESRLHSHSHLTLGDVTTVNLTVLKAGVQYNVVPPEAEAGFDIRIPPSVDLAAFKAQLDTWAAEEGVSYEFINYHSTNPVTAIDESNVWWLAFKQACADMKLNIKPEVFPAATDSRFLRECGLPALGFSPMPHTPILLHDHNEYISERVFLEGIEVYTHILPALANVKA